ncbi:MAG TPA: hypothetical protein VM008_12010 [Phycisphaerae bacterium]|nr:hypothetical protein [Phycisphaerae bacterium]
MTMLVLVLAVTVLSRQMLRTTVLRMSSASATFGVEAQWIAEGVARQWQEQSRDSKVNVDDLLRPVSWEVHSNAFDVPTSIEVFPSSTQSKLYLPAMAKEDWLAFWQHQSTSITLADDPDTKLLESGSTALEVILSAKHISAQDAYLPALNRGQSVAPADVMTVWGDGRLDLNRASREVLQARLKTFTDAQISGILRIRASGPIKDITQINDELSLSEDQSRLLSSVAAYAPSFLELVIRIRHGGLCAVYFSVITVGKEGQVLEVRPIL